MRFDSEEEIITLKIFVKFLRILPNKVALMFGAFIGRVLHLVLWKKVDLCESRCVKALGVGVTIAREIIKKSFINLGMSAVEFIRIPVIKSQLPELVEFDEASQNILREALSRGHGVILMCTHMASWELVAARFVQAGFDLHAVYTPQRDNKINAIISDIRENFTGMHMITSEGGGLREIFKVLKSGGIIVIMQDLDARKDGIITKFLGMNASTHEGIAKLYHKFKCPVIPLRYVRDWKRPAHQVVKINEILSDRLDKNGRKFGEDITESINLCNQIIEGWIKETPEQWLWILDKWQYGQKI